MSATPARWTFFVPLTGLDLDQSANLTEPPLFGDATIVSGASIAHIFESDDRQAHHSAGAFIAVQRRAAIAGTAPYFDAYKVNRNFVATARARVREIAALMAVVVVASTNEGRVVGVPEQHQYQDEHYRMYCVDDGQTIEVTGHGLATDTFINGYELDHWRLSRTDLETLLTYPGHAALVRLFGQQKKAAQTSLRRTIIDATVQLAAAIHGGSYVNQLLSAVISLDIMLSTDVGTSFEQKKRRLRTLIGDDIYE